MLRAYFDDSGTHTGGKHGPSDIVLVAGIFGTEGRMDSLDRNWRRHIEAPIDGLKDRIGRFHATECNESRGEFTGWSRTETDYFRHQLRTVIIESDVAGYGIACSRKDYEEIIGQIGVFGAVLGTPEGFCINQCFVRAIGWVQANTFDPHMTIIFDNRPPEVQRYAAAVCDAFERWTQPPPELIGHSFMSSKAIRPLQAADLVAWELYQHANDILEQGRIDVPVHKELKHLVSNMDFNAQFASRESLLQLRQFWQEEYRKRPEILEQMAKHFDAFDPKNPDYSHLSDEPRC